MVFQANFLSAYLNQDKSRATTHTSLAGGSHHVPCGPISYPDPFLSDYLNAFRAGKPLYLTERVPKSEPFRWFGDLDYPFTDSVRDWTPKQRRRFYQLNLHAVHSALDSLELSHFNPDVKLSVRAAKIHVHIPGLVVHATCARAFLAVVEKAVQTEPIKAELLALLGMDNFDKVFDGSVYASGLRMLGSRKPADKDKDPAWVTDKIYQVVDADFEVIDLTLDDDLEVFIEVLVDCSIFNLNGDPVTRIAETPSASTSASSSSSQVRTNQESHTVIVRQEHLDTLKAGLGTVLMYRPQEILSFKKYAKSLVVELDDMYCPGLKRKHTSNRSYLVISATAVSQKCSSPQCSDNPAATVKTALGVFPDAFKELVQRLLQPSIPQIPQVSQTAQEPEPEPQEIPDVMDELVSPCVAKQRFDHHNEFFPGSAEMECVRRDNILVSRVVKDSGSGMSALDGIICATHDHFCQGTQLACTSTHGLEITCDACSFRFPSKASVYLPVEKQSFPSLHQFLVQVNNTSTTNNITINNYNGENMQLDVQFNAIEPIFPDPDLNLVMFRSFNGHSGDIAYVVVYHVGRDVFGVVSKKDATEWWAWDSRVGRWNTGKHYLEYFCMRTMVGYYEEAQQYFRLHTVDPTLAKNREIRFEQIRKRLNDRELVHIVNSAAVHFKTHSPNFEASLDANPALIGFTNGVYDLDKREFREANPADFMTMSCGYAFEHKVDPVIRAEIDKFFEDIQPGPDERRYLQKFLGSCIRGGAKVDELFHIFTGETRNGKSVLADAMKYALGDYYTTIKATMLTGQQGASSEASPDMMDLKNRRLAIASEPEKGKTINSGFMKGLTGNDDIVARQLYGEIVKFKPTHATVFLTNDIPPMDQSDAAVKARLVIVPFPTLFTSVVTMPHHRPIDLTLKHRVKSWGPQLMLRLIEWNEWYCEEGLAKPRRFENSTDSYAMENNLPYKFHETITRYDAKECLHIGDMIGPFKAWHLEETGVEYKGDKKSFAASLRQQSIVTCEFRWKGSEKKVGIKNRTFV